MTIQPTDALSSLVIQASSTTQVERNYLEVIYYLADRREPVIAAQIVRWLRVSPPTVSNILQRLERKGLIERNAYGVITLSVSGLSLAEQVVRRHRMIERFLFDHLAIPWHEIHREANQLEGALSPLLESRILSLVGQATTCPHGNPIPGQTLEPFVDETLSQAPVGAQFTITRIDEEAGEDTCTLQLFWMRQLVPGTILMRLPDPREGVALRHGGRRLVLNQRQADLIRGTWVNPVS